MAKSQVTITLGRSGQRVVKEPWGESQGTTSRRPSNASVPSSGIKRSLPLPETTSFRFNNNNNNNTKRMREDAGASSYRYGTNAHGPKDLRLKLMQKRMSKRIEREIEERKKKELCERVSKTIRSMESPERSLPRGTPVSRGGMNRAQMDSYESSYAERLRTRSPDRVVQSSSGVSTPRSTLDELPSVRPMDASRARGAIMSNPFGSSNARVPLTTPTVGTLDSVKLIKELPPAAVGMSGPPYTETQPLTVSSLLNSLGLGKYLIHFQAEEIDMVALKQMGDRDLKELGIPMGPRKKILLALQARTKRPMSQALINSLQ